jgi:hypothetical protein
VPTIDLDYHVGLGVIIEYPSGVLYSNQTGGTSTLHPSIEGVFVPIRNELSLPSRELMSPETELFEYFEGPKHRGTGATSGLDAEDAAFIEAVLDRWSVGDLIALDRDRLSESHEAWVRVLLSSADDALSVFRGFGPYPRPGVLIWTNTD